MNITILEKDGKKELCSEVIINKIKDEEFNYICFKLREYLQSKWKDLNFNNIKDVIKANYEFNFLIALDEYFKKHRKNKDLLCFLENEIIKNLSLNDIIKILENTSISTIEKRIETDELYDLDKYACYVDYKLKKDYAPEYINEEAWRIYKNIKEPDKISKNNRQTAIALWEFECKCIYDMYDNWILAREELLNKYERKHKIIDLKRKFIEFALLNDIASIFDSSINSSEYKHYLDGKKINKNTTVQELLNTIKEIVNDIIKE